MRSLRDLALKFLIACGFGVIATSAMAEVQGDVNNDGKIDLVESVYALRVVSQTTSAVFTTDDLNGKTFYEVHEESSGGEICIIESRYDTSTGTVAGKEWRYINDDTWIEGCEEEYIPNDADELSFELTTDGALAITVAQGEEPWVIRLVERFSDNFLTSNMDGTATWYFTREKVNAVVDPKIKFTQAILANNYWYIVETYPDDPEHPDCNGKFDFDGNITLQVQWQDGDDSDAATGVYALHTGSLITHHDQKVETETIWTYSPDEIRTVKTVLHENGSTDGTGTVKRWFKDKSTAENYLTNLGNATTCFPLSDGTVKSVGRIWMDRNLGASRVATSSNDSEAYGDLYEWGRGTDGHEKRTASLTTDLSPADDPQHVNYILAPSSPYDWRMPQNNDLWQGPSGTNNPCPEGFRLPTDEEFESERATWSSDNAAGAFHSPLRLVTAGNRNYSSGTLDQSGSIGYYWTSTAFHESHEFSRALYISSENMYVTNYYRSSGFSIRCIKD